MTRKITSEIFTGKKRATCVICDIRLTITENRNIFITPVNPSNLKKKIKTDKFNYIIFTKILKKETCQNLFCNYFNFKHSNKYKTQMKEFKL